MSGALARAAAERVSGPDGSAGAPLTEALLREWMDRHGEELHRHVSRMLPAEADADDVLQEVWITAHRRPPDAGPGSNVRAWLYRVATNAALDRLARDRRRRTALCGRGHELAPDVVEVDAGLDGLGERAKQRVKEQVARLPRKQREAVWLRWVEGAEYERIARELDCSVESARANVYNGMKKLRTELFDLWQGGSAA